MSDAALSVRGLSIGLPNGNHLLSDVSLSIEWGEVVALVGASGSGKSTFSRVLFERATMMREGFAVAAEAIDVDPTTLGLVPQRGAPFDHLDVRGNIGLALAASKQPVTTEAIGEWLNKVGLPVAWAEKGRDVTTLSGGQLQRLAICRALASGRAFLFLDEPSVGLDPKAVSELAALLRQQVEGAKRAAIIVTHDVEFACAACDRVLLLDPDAQTIRQVAQVQDNQQPSDAADELRAVLATQKLPPSAGGGRRRRFNLLAGLSLPFQTLGAVAVNAFSWLRCAGIGAVMRRVATQALVRPLLFYAAVSTLIGYTVLFVMSKVGGSGVRAEAVLEQIGGSYAVALAPPISAMLFAATSASATNAWLGGIQLTKQSLALRAIGLSTDRYLVVPSWLMLTFAYLICAAVFAFGLIAGGAILCQQHGIDAPLSMLAADFLDPVPSRSHNLRRLVILVVLYAAGLAANAVAKGMQSKRTADDVTRSMTSNVVSSTIWIVALELGTAMVVLPQ